MTRLLISSLPGELRAALLDGGRLADLWVERGRSGGAVGDIHRAKVKRLDRKAGAAFCDIGMEEDGFLPLDAAPAGLSEGDALTLRVTRAASGGKGAKLTRHDEALPPGLGTQGGPSLLLRANDPVAALAGQGAAGSAPPEEILTDDPAMLNRLKRLLDPAQAASLKLYSGAQPLFEAEGVEPQIEALLSPEVALPGGGRLWIEPTRALVAIDVDRVSAASAEAVNLEAAREIARQLRLRALAGLIVIDFLDPEGPEARKALRAALEAALANDTAPMELQRLGGNGVLVMTRARRRPALHECLAEPGEAWRPTPETQAYAALRAALSAGLAEPAKRPRLLVTPALAAVLDGSAAEAVMAVGKRLGRPLEVAPRPARPEDDRGFSLVLE